jgi:hypothetical protein
VNSAVKGLKPNAVIKKILLNSCPLISHVVSFLKFCSSGAILSSFDDRNLYQSERFKLLYHLNSKSLKVTLSSFKIKIKRKKPNHFIVLVFREAHEKELKDLRNIIIDLQRQREQALREVAELKVQLKMVEESRDCIRRDLIEANRKIREGKNNEFNIFCSFFVDTVYCCFLISNRSDMHNTQKKNQLFKDARQSVVT